MDLMPSRFSANPECRQRTLELLCEQGEQLIDWIARLKYFKGLADRQIIEFAAHRGFLDEEIEGTLRNLDARFEDDTDFFLDAMLGIASLPTATLGTVAKQDE